MILDSVLWLVSTPEETCWFLMKEERKRMKAFGGRGIWFSGFFFACAARRVAVPPSLAGKRSDSALDSVGLGGSLNLPGVTFGGNAIVEIADTLTRKEDARADSAKVCYQSDMGMDIDDHERCTYLAWIGPWNGGDCQ